MTISVGPRARVRYRRVMSSLARATWPRVWAISTASWTAIALVQSLAAFVDRVRRGEAGGLVESLELAPVVYLPWLLFTPALFILLVRVHDRQPGVRPALRWFAIFGLLFYVPQVVYQALVFLVLNDLPLQQLPIRLGNWPAMAWLIDFGFYLTTFAVVYAVVAIGSALDAQRRRQEADAENLTLRLELERQRLSVLRAQLEPHFLFNALNAISGLVRGDSKPLALSALQQLSALLRYALTASGRDWVTVGEELAFVRDYVTLQSLRYGDRLRVSVVGETPVALAADCPPLLLQPLIENAIRHDLECHEGTSEILIELVPRGNRLTIRVGNSRQPNVTPNPGVGFGLPMTRDRLTLLYGASATVTVVDEGPRFQVTIDIPIQGHD